MTRTLPGADYRGFYAALGVQLPGWAHTEAPVRCFADPEAHAHGDRDASCSVNVHSGLFNCHGCGASGGAYDAAKALGRSPRAAMDLLVLHGLAERRPPRRDPSRFSSPASTRDTSRGSAARTNPEAAGATRRRAPARRTEADPRPLPAALTLGQQPASVVSVSGGDVRRWAQALRSDVELLARLRRERGWDGAVLRELGIGFDGERITVPITDDQALQGVLRLRVDAAQRPKVLAAPGTRLGLIPHPSAEGERLLLVEGPSDMLAARSAGLAAIAVPGTHAWRAEWGRSFAGREVTVVMDADRPGREAAVRIARDLEGHGARTAIVDLDPRRDDGYDLSDWLRAGHKPSALPQARPFTSQAYDRTQAASASSGASRPTGATARAAGASAITQPGAVVGPGGDTGGRMTCRTF